MEICVRLTRAGKRNPPIFIRVTNGEMLTAIKNEPTTNKRLKAYYDTIRLLALAGF